MRGRAKFSARPRRIKIRHPIDVLHGDPSPAMLVRGETLGRTNQIPTITVRGEALIEDSAQRPFLPFVVRR